MLLPALVMVTTGVMLSEECLTRYITNSIDGYVCKTSVYTNFSDVGFHRCIGSCIVNETCWMAAYNHDGRYRLLANDPCVSADIDSKFSMTVLKVEESHQCVHWTSFSSTFGKENGYPTRAIRLHGGRDDTIGRAMYGPDMLTGWSTSSQYEAYLIGWNGRILLPEYDVLLVGNDCVTAWVPYMIGDPMPRQAVVAEVNRDGRNVYAFRKIIEDGIACYGSYTEGSALGYYEASGVQSTTDIHLLVELY